MQIDGRRSNRWSRAAFLWGALSLVAARGQAMEQVLADAPAILHVNRLVDPTATTRPATGQDPIADVEALMGIRPAGVDPDRDAVVYLPNWIGDDEPAPVVLLLPVADYAAFLAAQSIGTTEAGVTALRRSGHNADTF